MKGFDIMQDKRFAELKAALFDWGRDYIEEFLGYEYPFGEDPGVTEARMDAVYRDSDEETLEDFYRRFCIEEVP